MSSDNKPEPVVTPCDEDAAKAFLAHYYKTAGAFDIALILAFAAHRTAAVARREAEIVGMLSDIASSQHRQCRECEKHRDEEGANAHEHAYEIICAAVVKIQNGGGA